MDIKQDIETMSNDEVNLVGNVDGAKKLKYLPAILVQLKAYWYYFPKKPLIK